MTPIVKRILCLALCALLACGCALADAAPEGVLAVINGRAYSAEDVQAEFDYYAAMYEAYGLSDEIEALKDDIIEYYVQYYVQLDAARQLGLDEFSDEELEEISARAQETYDATLAEYMASFAEEGVSEEDVRAATVLFLEGNAYTPESVMQSLVDSEIMERYYDYVTADVEVDIEAQYDRLVAEQKADYDADPMNFEYDVMYEGDIYYIPEGFRAVYHILLLLDDADAGTLADLQGRQREIGMEMDAEDADTAALGAELESIDEQIDELCAPLRERADEIYARLEAGENFFDLMDEYGEDPGMREEPYRTKGYYVSADSAMWVEEFRDAAMALEKEGDVSGPVLTSYGIHLIMHGGELASGAVPLEGVREALTETALTDAQQAAYSAAVEAAVEAADIVVYPENVVYVPSDASAAG